LGGSNFKEKLTQWFEKATQSDIDDVPELNAIIGWSYTIASAEFKLTPSKN